MKYNSDGLISGKDVKVFGEWTTDWYQVRGRHPFFIYDEISPETVRVVELFRDIFPSIGREIDVIIDSPGGPVESSFKAPYFLKTFCPNYAAIIPEEAKSGATLFALGASEIVMGQWAELGPLDPQISRTGTDRHYFSSPESALESFHALRFAQKEVTEYMDRFVEHLTFRGIAPRHAVREAKDLVEATIGRIYSNVSPFELGNSGRALEVMEKYCYKILNNVYDKDENKKEISKNLVWNYPDHGFFIDSEEAKKIGLNVRLASEKEQQLLNRLHNDILEGGNAYCIGTLIPVQEDKENEGRSKNGRAKSRKTQEART